MSNVLEGLSPNFPLIWMTGLVGWPFYSPTAVEVSSSGPLRPAPHSGEAPQGCDIAKSHARAPALVPLNRDKQRPLLPWLLRHHPLMISSHFHSCSSPFLCWFSFLICKRMCFSVSGTLPASFCPYSCVSHLSARSQTLRGDCQMCRLLRPIFRD